VIKATATINGRKTLVLGLSFGNLDRFRAEPEDTYIKVDGRELGLPIDVLVISGETEASIAALLSAGIGPGTKVVITEEPPT
jgi:hypothetical protein